MEVDILMFILGFIGAMIPIITVIVKLNSTITKLNVSIDNLLTQMGDSKLDRKSIHKQLNEHETRITLLENRKGVL